MTQQHLDCAVWACKVDGPAHPAVDPGCSHAELMSKEG